MPPYENSPIQAVFQTRVFCISLSAQNTTSFQVLNRRVILWRQCLTMVLRKARQLYLKRRRFSIIRELSNTKARLDRCCSLFFFCEWRDSYGYGVHLESISIPPWSKEAGKRVSLRKESFMEGNWLWNGHYNETL